MVGEGIQMRRDADGGGDKAVMGKGDRDGGETQSAGQGQERLTVSGKEKVPLKHPASPGPHTPAHQ